MAKVPDMLRSVEARRTPVKPRSSEHIIKDGVPMWRNDFGTFQVVEKVGRHRRSVPNSVSVGVDGAYGIRGNNVYAVILGTDEGEREQRPQTTFSINGAVDLTVVRDDSTVWVGPAGTVDTMRLRASATLHTQNPHEEHIRNWEVEGEGASSTVNGKPVPFSTIEIAELTEPNTTVVRAEAPLDEATLTPARHPRYERLMAAFDRTREPAPLVVRPDAQFVPASREGDPADRMVSALRRQRDGAAPGATDTGVTETPTDPRYARLMAALRRAAGPFQLRRDSEAAPAGEPGKRSSGPADILIGALKRLQLRREIEEIRARADESLRRAKLLDEERARRATARLAPTELRLAQLATYPEARLTRALGNEREHIRPDVVSSSSGADRLMYPGGVYHFYATRDAGAADPVVVRDWMNTRNSFLIQPGNPLPGLEVASAATVHFNDRVEHAAASNGGTLIVDATGNGAVRAGSTLITESIDGTVEVDGRNPNGKRRRNESAVLMAGTVNGLVKLAGETDVIVVSGLVEVTGRHNSLNKKKNMRPGLYRVDRETGEIRLERIDTNDADSPKIITTQVGVNRANVAADGHFLRTPYVEVGHVGGTLITDGAGDLYIGGSDPETYDVSQHKPSQAQVGIGRHGAREVVLLGNSHVIVSEGVVARLDAQGTNNVIELRNGAKITDLVGSENCQVLETPVRRGRRG